MKVTHDEQTLAWEIRRRWAAHKPVVLTLSERCMVHRVEGLIEYVAVTGAYVIVDGWHGDCAWTDRDSHQVNELNYG